jgi:anti-sigma B factor antagonist
MSRTERRSASLDIAAPHFRGGVSFTEQSLESGALVLTVAGELDVATAPQLRDRLNAAIDADRRQLVVDLSDVTFVDSLSLAAIVGAQNRLGGVGQLAIVAQHPYVLLIFEAGGLDSVLELFSTRDEAVAYVQG